MTYKLPEILALLVTLGFFAVLAMLMIVGAPDKGGAPVLVLLGSLGTAWTTIMAFYFGSSDGSAKKSEQINAMINNDPTIADKPSEPTPKV